MAATEPIDVSENPFFARRVRPGAIPFIFPPGQNAETLVERLRQSGWRGEIVGPHGSGKSTLAVSLAGALERAGCTVVMVSLHDGQRRLPLNLRRDAGLRPPAVLIVDGYEQLGRLSRWTLNRWCRRSEIGLLVTAHAPVGFPAIFRTEATLDVARQVVDALLDGRNAPFSTEEIAQRLSRYGGDLRETLFDLYDLYEKRRPPPSENVT